MQLNLLLTRLYRNLKSNKVSLIYIPLAIYWGIIFIATSIPIDPMPKLFNAQDKLEHFTAYFILAVLFSFTFHFQEKVPLFKKYFFILSMLLIMFYGALDELHQLIVPGRYCDILDWLADVTGGLIGIIAVHFFINSLANRQVQNL